MIEILIKILDQENGNFYVIDTNEKIETTN